MNLTITLIPLAQDLIQKKKKHSGKLSLLDSLLVTFTIWQAITSSLLKLKIMAKINVWLIG